MGSLDKRIEALEKLYHSSTAEEHYAAEVTREELLRKAWAGTLNALAHIKRALIDRPQWRYEVENLKDKGPFAIACYIATLTHLEHPDEERAREILEEAVAERGIEGAPLGTMIDSLVAEMNHMREKIERHAERREDGF
jgi:hypothetical protein